ncbi:hypothetical protein PSDVSF_05400 [Pseudodesulfovibrio sediminis]|uniref:YutG/PgpA domain-containing protein n=1 Tax=Pseudodesulfovibrio sediminis TaxID=2810563 RepID=A0ABM7P378_9BACT|nr:hypothetical protein PSDVSF_05400 [Pseudodesulfovibrio sediminis]
MLAVILLIGTWASTRAEIVYDKKDPGCVIIDELFGQWICILFFTSMPIWYLAAAFALFRFFDILKPWPIKWAENRFKDGLGVMLDDGVAGFYALGCLHLMHFFLSMN